MKQIKVLDLFAGLQGWSAPWRERGHDVITLDLDPAFGCDISMDILDFKPSDHLPEGWVPDVILASPPCEGFTVLTIMKNWTRPTDDPPHQPKTDQARLALSLVEKTREIIEELLKAGTSFFIVENPRAKLRALPVLADLEMVTVHYCQYGEQYMKPTDLWGGFPRSWVPRPTCDTNPRDPALTVEVDGHQWRVNKVTGEPCHRAAPRGSRTGVQGELVYKDTSGKKLSAVRAEIPEALSLDILAAVERDLDG